MIKEEHNKLRKSLSNNLISCALIPKSVILTNNV